MSKINVFALGGLGENGKNMVVVEVDDRIFVIDAGLKYPSVDLYGVDAVVPDINYLIENKDRIEGLFISHGHEDHIGAISYLLSNINIRVYGTHFTISLIEDFLTENNMNYEDYRLYRINENKTLKFNNVIVSFYNTTHSIPESIAIALHTPDGVIVYCTDFNFNQNAPTRYKTSFEKITDLGKQNVLLLMAESIGAGIVNRSTTDYMFNYTVTNALNNANGRVIVTAFSTDLDRIQKVINLAVDANRKIAIIGRKAQRIIDIAMSSGYLKVPSENFINLKFIDEKNTNEFDDMVVIVTGVRHEPFYVLQRMIRKQDRLIHLNSNDSILMMTTPVPGTEKIAQRTIDMLNREDISIEKIGKDILRSSHANNEDLKLLYSLLKPKYVLPIKGEYRHLIEQAKVAKDYGYDDNHIIIIENGQVVNIENGAVTGYSNVEVGDVLVDGSIIGDINEVVLRDREVLAQEGAILVISNISARNQEILTGPEIVTKGFVYSDDKEELHNQIVTTFNKIATNYLKKRAIDWNGFKKSLTDEISKIIYKAVHKRPIIIPVLIDTQV